MTAPLYVDWDGTATVRDTLHMLIERFGDLDVFRAMEAELERELTLDEVITAELKTVTAPFAEVVAWLLEHVALRPGFRELVAVHDPTIVSAGFEELIAPILAREGIAVRVVANSVVADPAGWRARFLETPLCAVCGERCKRGVIGAEGPYVYVGDGVSDRCVALGAERIFARAGLATWLAGRGVAHEPFVDLTDVVRALG
ncbi:MAG: haloacid dehalogenase-like hydrolase [Gaiellales bacterium]